MNRYYYLENILTKKELTEVTEEYGDEILDDFRICLFKCSRNYKILVSIKDTYLYYWVGSTISKKEKDIEESLDWIRRDINTIIEYYNTDYTDLDYEELENIVSASFIQD